MREIKLTQGKVALVDDSDYEWLNQWKWCAVRSMKTFYAERIDCSGNKRVKIKMHRLILGISDGLVFVDHIDQNGLNNQRNNIRPATRSQNGCNRASRAGSSSRYLGVCWDKKASKWAAQLTSNKKKIHLGRFENEIDAALSYNEGAKIYHGDFCRLNNVV